MGRKTRTTTVIVAVLGAVVGYLYLHLRWQVESLPWDPPAPPRLVFGPGTRARVIQAGVRFAMPVEQFRDELFTYLMLQHFRTAEAVAGARYRLVYRGETEQASFEILLSLSDGVMESYAAAAELSTRLGLPLKLLTLPEAEASRFEKQTRLFDAAYNLPVKRKLEQLPAGELRTLMRRFIRFKSTTDPRIRAKLEPPPKVLSADQAEQLAGDMLAVAEFYQLPLDYLLGIGAMENNYMDVRGDLQHSIWKRRPAKDDIVLERRGGRVRVLNYSTGVWQITRETLRYAHRQYLKDKRDYSKLPEHLRPPAALDVNEVRPEILTTYAGLLLRDLLDQFDGQVGLAVGAYNGGPARPNPKYEKGVRQVATYARGVLERAAALSGESVLHRSWIGPR